MCQIRNFVGIRRVDKTLPYEKDIWLGRIKFSMTVKARIATGAMDLTIEAETTEQAREFLKMLRDERYLREPAGSTAPEQGARSRPKIELGAMLHDEITAPLPESGELPKVVQSDGRHGLLTLRAKLHEAPGQVSRAADAALVLLLGYSMQGKESTYGTTLMKSLRQTGYNIDRVDRPLEPYQKEGLILTSGIKKSRAYHLTEHGKIKAQELVSELTAMLGGST